MKNGNDLFDIHIQDAICFPHKKRGYFLEHMFYMQCIFCDQFGHIILKDDDHFECANCGAKHT